MEDRLPGLTRVRIALLAVVAAFAGITILAPATFAQSAAPRAGIQGTVIDPSGAVIRQAQIEVEQNGRKISSTVTDADGHFSLALPAAGVYQLKVAAPSFQTVVRSLDVRGSTPRTLTIPLSLDRLSQQVTVTATGTPTLEQNVGSAVAVLTKDQFAHAIAIQEALRLIPGAQVTQSGQRGGTTALYIRGGNSNANQVLIDGTSINDIGGAIDFADIAAAGIQKIEILRGPNSAIYGADALAGVVSLSTTQGSTPLPQLDYLAEGGNFGTYHQEGTLSGRYRPFDYFTDYSRFDTSNSIPRDAFHDGSFTGNFGWSINPANSLRATIHHDRAATGLPNALLLYGIADNAKQAYEHAYGGATFDSHTTTRWSNTVRYGMVRQRSLYSGFSPTGIPQYDEDGDLLGYLGAPVTVKGANGYIVSGQAQYQYLETYPNYFAASTDRDLFSVQSVLSLGVHATGLFGFQYEDERGYSGGPLSESTHRGIYDYTLQVAGDLFGRLHYVVGSGIEKNPLFGVAATPRASLAFELVDRGGNLTKLRASFGKGIKEPALFDQETSLYTLLSSLPSGPQLISQYHVAQVGAENSRSFDGGVDQTIENGRGRISLTLFHSQYTNGIEYIPQQGLTQLGVPAPIVANAPYGATVNSEAFRAQGVDLEAEQRLGSHWFARGGYTYLDAVVERSFSSDAIGPSFNPNFPDIPIGADTPLVGARPFRRAPHSGYFGVGYNRSRLSGLLTGSLVGRRDDTDFLSYDANYLPTMLLPNRNLAPSYQRIDLAVSYAASRRVTFLSSFQNLLSQHAGDAFGYPGLPFTFRGGMRISLGGESWKWK